MENEPMHSTSESNYVQPHSQDPPSDPGINPDSIAVKRWLRQAIDRLELLPKQVYMELRIDSSTFSRYESLQHEHTVPMGLLPGLLRVLDQKALDDLIAVLRRPV